MSNTSLATQNADGDLEHVWRFVRGDTPPKEFEAWICTSPHLEARVGESLYFDALAGDYRNHDVVDDLKRRLAAWARGEGPACACFSLRDLAVVHMGHHEDVFASLGDEITRGAPYWWLSMSRCSVCADAWLVGQDERQNDLFCMRRLDRGAFERARDGGDWPSDFDLYETLLRIAADAGCSVRFLDPLDSSLRWTVVDLARARPGIRLSEIARLLNLDIETARTLACAAMGAEGVRIDLDIEIR